jgi:hypothetical protein
MLTMLVQHSGAQPLFRTDRAMGDLLYLATNPPSLCHLARRVIRQQLFTCSGGTSIIPAVFSLHYPPVLHQYLLLSDTRSCDIDATPPHHCVAPDEFECDFCMGWFREFGDDFSDDDADLPVRCCHEHHYMYLFDSDDSDVEEDNDFVDDDSDGDSS